MASYGFHPEALAEYENATAYYLEHGSPMVAAAFVAEVETAIQTVLASPETWRIVDQPNLRRYLLSRFPYALYYRWEPHQERVSIYAVMHFRRRPGYWRDRLS
jgi:toxin ParE1/3/4